MSFIKEWFKNDEERANEIIDQSDKVFMTKKNDFKTFDTREKFEKNMDEVINSNDRYIKYLEKEEIQKKYNKRKKELCDDFENRLNQDIENRKPKVEYIYRTSYVNVESEESKRIREENQKHEERRLKASNELPNFLDTIKNEFSKNLKDKILNVKIKIEEEVGNYPVLELKTFLKNLIKNENFENILIEFSERESDKILDQNFKNINHFNILLVGITGVGKST